MNFYEYLVSVVNEFKKGWEEVHSVPPEKVDPDGVKLTRDGRELKSYITSFIERQLKISLLSSDIKFYTGQLERANLLPNSAWNKMAKDNDRDVVNVIYFLSKWNGKVDELVI